MQIESLESRTFLSADGNTVTVPMKDSASGNLFEGFAEGTGTHLGKFTLSLDAATGKLTFVAANGDELWAQSTVLRPTDVDGVWHTEGILTGGTGRFAGATGEFSHDIFFTDNQGDFVYSVETTITLQRP
jgi:hypothetical protein